MCGSTLLHTLTDTATVQHNVTLLETMTDTKVRSSLLSLHFNGYGTMTGS